MINLKKILFEGKEVEPLVEGGKGIAVSNGETAGAWAKCGGVGTFSGVMPDSYDESGKLKQDEFLGKTREERQDELVESTIKGSLEHAKKAHEISGGKGLVNMNVLWEMGGTERILEGVLAKAKGLINGITCGAGMPYKLAEIASKFKVYYNPIVSSARALSILWKRSYAKFSDWLGGVVYEDPWLAGGHSGMSNAEDPNKPEDPYERVKAIRDFLVSVGQATLPIIIAGGVWCLAEWGRFIDNPELGPVAFQFGTRTMVTKESPLPDAWKQKMLTLKEDDVLFQDFSPTGFYSSAVKNKFIENLVARSARQVEYRDAQEAEFNVPYDLGSGGSVFVTSAAMAAILAFAGAGFTKGVKTPSGTLVFESPEELLEIRKSQRECSGCLSRCLFSGFAQNKDWAPAMTDIRKFCISKALRGTMHSDEVDEYLLFSGRNGYRFAKDEMYRGGHIPTVEELFEAIKKGK